MSHLNIKKINNIFIVFFRSWEFVVNIEACKWDGVW